MEFGCSFLQTGNVWAVADPDYFPQSGRQPGGGGGCRGGRKRQPIIWPNFPQNCTRIKKIRTRGANNLSMKIRH